jgi:Phospholipase_D-nuclease N-terminal
MNEMDGWFSIFFLVWVAGFILWIWALVDVVRMPDTVRFKTGDKLMWVLVVCLTSFIGAIIYLVVGRPAGGRGGQDGTGVGGTGQPPIPPPPTGTV